MKTGKLSLRNHVIHFDHPVIMGVLNITPDSFSNGGRFLDPGRACEHTARMVAEGAEIIDIGGESSRPGSAPVDENEELRRIMPVLERLLRELPVPVSIDTAKPRVAEACLEQGAHMINDITGLRDPAMIEVIATHRTPAVIMHMRGTPQTMQENPVYDDVIREVLLFLKEQADAARRAGIPEIVLDPGIGFGKRVEDNLKILRRLEEFKSLGNPLMAGTSRKSFIGAITGFPVDQRLEGTLASVAIAVLNGADIVRVHDVKKCRHAAQVAYAIRTGSFRNEQALLPK